MHSKSPNWLPIYGSRVLIRSLSEEDLHELYELEIDPWVKHFIRGGVVETSREAWLARAVKLCSSDHVFCVASRQTNLLLGRVSVGHYLATGRSTNREIQILLCRNAVGNRLGEEAFQLIIEAAKANLGATRLFVEIHKDHPHSASLAKAFGFVENVALRTHSAGGDVRIFALDV